MNRIKEVLEEKGIKQIWLAEKLGKSFNTVNSYVQNRFRENHRFQIPDGCHWKDIRATSTDIGKKLQTALHEIEKAN
jgi:hypothetical protein